MTSPSELTFAVKARMLRVISEMTEKPEHSLKRSVAPYFKSKLHNTPKHAGLIEESWNRAYTTLMFDNLDTSETQADDSGTFVKIRIKSNAMRCNGTGHKPFVYERNIDVISPLDDTRLTWMVDQVIHDFIASAMITYANGKHYNESNI